MQLLRYSAGQMNVMTESVLLKTVACLSVLVGTRTGSWSSSMLYLLHPSCTRRVANRRIRLSGSDCDSVPTSHCTWNHTCTAGCPVSHPIRMMSPLLKALLSLNAFVLDRADCVWGRKCCSVSSSFLDAEIGSYNAVATHKRFRS